MSIGGPTQGFDCAFEEAQMKRQDVMVTLCPFADAKVMLSHFVGTTLVSPLFLVRHPFVGLVATMMVANVPELNLV